MEMSDLFVNATISYILIRPYFKHFYYIITIELYLKCNIENFIDTPQGK